MVFQRLPGTPAEALEHLMTTLGSWDPLPDLYKFPHSYFLLFNVNAIRGLDPNYCEIISTFGHPSVPYASCLAMALPGPLQTIFDDAKREFQSKLPAGTRFQDLLGVTTINELYDATDKLQLNRPTRLRSMNRIRPFLARIQAFTG